MRERLNSILKPSLVALRLNAQANTCIAQSYAITLLFMLFMAEQSIF